MYTDPGSASSLGVSFHSLRGERVYFFAIDVSEDARSRFLRFAGLHSGSRICDLLVLLVCEGMPSRLCPVELKGRNISHGLTQLSLVCGGLAEQLPPEAGPSPSMELFAALISTASEPRKSRRYRRARNDLERSLGADRLLIKTGMPRGGTYDLGQFLRS